MACSEPMANKAHQACHYCRCRRCRRRGLQGARRPAQPPVNTAAAGCIAAGALAQAEKEAVGASNATSIDYKIAQQLARSKRPAAKQATKQSRTQVGLPSSSWEHG